MSESLLTIENLEVAFGPLRRPIQAVRGVSLTLQKGECLGIVGESGSGKSVTAAAAAGLLGIDARTKGTIVIGSQSVQDLGPSEWRRLHGRTVAMIFQEPSRSFDPIMNLEKTFLETFRAHRPETTKSESRARAVALLSEVHIVNAERRLGSFPHQFSGGMLQRVMIALALANDPEILICDEPTTALDVTVQAQILSLLKELQSRRQLSLVFISHDLETVSQMADRLVVLYGGLVMEQGLRAELLTKPRHPYTRALWESRVRRGTHYSKDALSLIGGSPPDPQAPGAGCPFAPRCSRADAQCHSELPPLTGQARPVRCWHPWEEE